jgi:hypothetical protein
VLYVNDGDWVESCTAVVEHPDGRLEILEWARRRRWSALDRSVADDGGFPEAEKIGSFSA